MSPDTPTVPPLDQVKGRIRAAHAQIRTMLDDLERKLRGADAASAPAGRLKELTDDLWTLFRFLDVHMAMEERELVPHLYEVRGQPAVEHLQQEHREQRSILLTVVNEWDACAKPAVILFDDARWLVRSLRRDMNREDAKFDKVAPTSLFEEGSRVL